jgi:hypothetical protein
MLRVDPFLKFIHESLQLLFVLSEQFNYLTLGCNNGLGIPNASIFNTHPHHDFAL